MDIDDFYRGVVEDTSDAILFSDAEGIIRFWNAGAERMFGFTSQEAIGKSLDIIVPQALRARHWQGYAATMRSGKTRYGSGELLAVPALRKDGTRISVEFSIIPFRDDANAMIGIAAVMRDVTARFEELKTLRRALSAPLQGGDSAGDT